MTEPFEIDRPLYEAARERYYFWKAVEVLPYPEPETLEGVKAHFNSMIVRENNMRDARLDISLALGVGTAEQLEKYRQPQPLFT